jgi:hypothetical protein
MLLSLNKAVRSFLAISLQHTWYKMHMTTKFYEFDFDYKKQSRMRNDLLEAVNLGANVKLKLRRSNKVYKEIIDFHSFFIHKNKMISILPYHLSHYSFTNFLDMNNKFNPVNVMLAYTLDNHLAIWRFPIEKIKGYGSSIESKLLNLWVKLKGREKFPFTHLKDAYTEYEFYYRQQLSVFAQDIRQHDLKTLTDKSTKEFFDLGRNCKLRIKNGDVKIIFQTQIIIAPNEELGGKNIGCMFKSPPMIVGLKGETIAHVGQLIVMLDGDIKILLYYELQVDDYLDEFRLHGCEIINKTGLFTELTVPGSVDILY